MSMVHLKIKHLREHLNITQEQMAQYLCISQNSYSLMENGKSKIDVARLSQVAKKLKVGLPELLREEHNNDDPADTDMLMEQLKEAIYAKDQQLKELTKQNALLLSQIEKLTQQ